ncbi:glycerophosphodiester phosphodiesterase [Paenibacillus radicis (ex Xue et al. 2023)]|uniref:Glycerophosphodiester phosphodiesterase n=1 Tax=Paenibacillus radicis (ex Xue et al. 2023) TaxID=2972489 RepID=A0ABT1YFG2_9BACL|nr:glycerophosphodiester phosphodiesterase [Paenibacillus radicis (ex Xue et al. 2023)]MCR8631662.1 glycerophosphodiester phosphodiesterase [Paenibacillus radicis (ex Xue et al. 2023)]
MGLDQTLVIAHRGAKGEAPENTLGAFRLGLEQGCDGIELDIHLTKDDEIIVIHDSTLDRTTDMTGSVHDMRLEEIKKADAGRWFHEKYEGERVPLLEEVFDLVPAEVMINVEIKHSTEGRLEPLLLDLMKKKDRMHNVVVSSFNHKNLLNLKKLEPEAKVGLLYELNTGSNSDLVDSFEATLYSLHPNYKGMDKETVSDAIALGLKVYPWTINDEDQMALAIDYGVSGIITDYPGRLRELLQQRRQQGAAE